MRVIPKTQAAQANLWAAQGDEFEKYCEAINFELLTGSGHDVRAQERQALRPPRSRRGGVRRCARPERVPAPGGSRWHCSAVRVLTARGKRSHEGSTRWTGPLICNPQSSGAAATATPSCSWCQVIRSPGQIDTTSLDRPWRHRRRRAILRPAHLQPTPHRLPIRRRVAVRAGLLQYARDEMPPAVLPCRMRHFGLASNARPEKTASNWGTSRPI